MVYVEEWILIQSKISILIYNQKNKAKLLVGLGQNILWTIYLRFFLKKNRSKHIELFFWYITFYLNSISLSIVYYQIKPRNFKIGHIDLIFRWYTLRPYDAPTDNVCLNRKFVLKECKVKDQGQSRLLNPSLRNADNFYLLYGMI